MDTGSSISVLLGVALGVYLVGMLGLSLWVRNKVSTVEDFLVAGRRLPLALAWPTLFATWYGAGTLLTATDEVRANGMVQAALEPFGPGVCLLLAGMFFAARLWRMNLLTLGDFYRVRFGKRAEVLASVVMVPGYCGWIAAQFVALSAVLQLFFGLEPWMGIALVAVVGTGYTLLGGMWAVTLTDAIQMALLLLGLVLLTFATFDTLGAGSLADGWSRLVRETPPAKLQLIPDRLPNIVQWVGIFVAGSLGNIPGQDLTQRVFAARSASTARNACYVAGVIYIVAGTVPLLVGLAGNLLYPEAGNVTILPFMAATFIEPFGGRHFSTCHRFRCAIDSG